MIGMFIGIHHRMTVTIYFVANINVTGGYYFNAG